MSAQLHRENSRRSKLVEKVGTRAKKRNEGRGERREVFSSFPPTSSICCCCCSCLCYQTYFPAFTRSETFVTQANVRKEFNYTTGLLWDSYITAVSLFWDTSMVDVMSCEK